MPTRGWIVLTVWASVLLSSSAHAQQVIGMIDGLAGTDQGSLSITGWACQSHVSTSLWVQLYVGGSYENGGISVSGATADEVSIDMSDAAAIDSNCGTHGIPHRFHIAITQEILRQHHGKTVYVYGISQIQGVYNNTLSRSGLNAIPTPSIIGNIDGITRPTDGSLSVSGWACQQYLATSIPVQLYVGGLYGSGISTVGTTANDPNESFIDAICGTSGIPHRFHISLKSDLRTQYAKKAMYIYGISQIADIYNMTLARSGTYQVPENGIIGFNYFPGSGADPSGCYGNPDIRLSPQPSWSNVSREIAADLILMKSLGVSTVRLPILPGLGTGWSRTWIESPANIRSFCNHLVDVLALFKTYGIKVVVDLHNYYWNPWDPNSWWFSAYDASYVRLFETDMTAFCAGDSPASSYQNYASSRYGVSSAGVAGASCLSKNFSAMEADSGFNVPLTRQRNKWRFYLNEAKTWAGTIVDMIEGSSVKDTVLYYDILNEYYAPSIWNERTGFSYDPSVNATTDTYIQEIYELLRSKGVKTEQIGVSVVGEESNRDGSPGTVNVSAAMNAIEAISIEGTSGSFGYLDVHYYPETSSGNYLIDLAGIQGYISARSPSTMTIVGELGRETHVADASWNEDKQEIMILNTLLHGMNQIPGIASFLNWGLWGGPGQNSFALGLTAHQPKKALAMIASLSSLISNGDMELVQNGVPSGWSAGGYVAVSLQSRATALTPDTPAATHDYYARATLHQGCGSGCWIWVKAPIFQVNGRKKLYISAYIRSDMRSIGLDIVQYDVNWRRLPDLTSPQFDPHDSVSWNNYLTRIGEQNPTIGSSDSSYGWTAITDPATQYVEVMIVGQGKSDGSSTYLDVDTVSAAASSVSP